MNKNKGIKLLTIVVLGVVLTILLGGQDNKTQKTEHQDPNNLSEAIASQFNDNIRDVSARMLENEKKIGLLEKKNKDLIAKNEALLSTKDKGGVVIREELSPEAKKTLETLSAEVARLKEKEKTQGPSSSFSSYPLGEVAQNTKKGFGKNIKDIDVALMQKKLSESEMQYWNKLNERRKSIHERAKRMGHAKMTQKEKPKGIPYYTIPAGSDLGHTMLLSALIGEVPSDGKLLQPLFPFSALISRGDLMVSNGISLPPDISGMKVNGYAIGVGSFLDNISCVRAYVTSVLFTFQDGHFVVVGKEEMKGSADLVNDESIGYLTTPYGNPCIHGKYFTNAPRVLAAMMAAGGTQGVGTALSQWQMSYFAGTQGGAAIPTGSFPLYAAGRATSDGSVKAADWLEKRIQGSFDMVFVPASFRCGQGKNVRWCANALSLHMMKTVSIDKEPQGRVINYGHQQIYNRVYSLR